jgi:hypothetical protein
MRVAIEFPQHAYLWLIALLILVSQKLLRWNTHQIHELILLVIRTKHLGCRVHHYRIMLRLIHHHRLLILLEHLRITKLSFSLPFDTYFDQPLKRIVVHSILGCLS